MKDLFNSIYKGFYNNRKILFFISSASLSIIVLLNFIYQLTVDPGDAFRSILVFITGVILVLSLFYCLQYKKKDVAKMIFFFFSGYIVYGSAINNLDNVFSDALPANYNTAVLFTWFLALIVIAYLVIFFLNHFLNVKKLQLAEDIIGLLVPFFIILYYIFRVVFISTYFPDLWINYVGPIFMIPAFFLFPLFRFFIEGFNGETEEKPVEEAPTEESNGEEVIEPEVLDSDMELEEKPAQVKREEE